MPNLSKTLRLACAVAILGAGGLPPALAKDTRSSAATSKSGYNSAADKDGRSGHGRGYDDHRRGPPGGFPDNHGQDQACKKANGHAPDHCHNDSLG